jgi:endoglucanase
MKKATRTFLIDIVNSVSPTGYEEGTQATYRRYMTPVADEVRTDSHGNTIAALNAAGNPRVMLAGHCDELGFQVHYVDDNGYLYFQPLGGHDESIVPGRRVTIHAAQGDVPGVIGKKAVHLMDEEERKKGAKIKDLWIDIGARDRARALELVQIGDPVTYNEEFVELDGGIAAARGFDDKIGVFVVGHALQLLHGGDLAAGVFAVSTVQEEIGLRGAHTSAFGIDPHVGIAVDVTNASDHPTVESKIVGEVKLGSGPVITRGPNINPKVFSGLVAAAERAKIPYQVKAANRGTGTDANAIQLTRAGVATGLVSIPNRYMHTPAELVSLDDAENAAKLLAEFIRGITGKENWSPE